MCPSDLRAMLSGAFTPLVESAKANESWVRSSTIQMTIIRGRSWESFNLAGIKLLGPHPRARPGKGAQGRST